MRITAGKTYELTLYGDTFDAVAVETIAFAQLVEFERVNAWGRPEHAILAVTPKNGVWILREFEEVGFAPEPAEGG